MPRLWLRELFFAIFVHHAPAFSFKRYKRTARFVKKYLVILGCIVEHDVL